ncbi:MAG TPA: hypothetical protein PKX38_07400 [Alphaproteobacteria bacterium]|jgi:hypothetical protein|nr:hypothetical protein [Micavibrio sp.]MBK9561571.1 hypothetical protein [Micavibrio sp.]HQX27746.1 hypothetical protein [Alphaproteobacteria bacterium]
MNNEMKTALRHEFQKMTPQEKASTLSRAEGWMERHGGEQQASSEMEFHRAATKATISLLRQAGAHYRLG